MTISGGGGGTLAGGGGNPGAPLPLYETLSSRASKRVFFVLADGVAILFPTIRISYAFIHGRVKIMHSTYMLSCSARFLYEVLCGMLLPMENNTPNKGFC